LWFIKVGERTNLPEKGSGKKELLVNTEIIRELPPRILTGVQFDFKRTLRVDLKKNSKEFLKNNNVSGGSRGGGWGAKMGETGGEVFNEN